MINLCSLEDLNDLLAPLVQDVSALMSVVELIVFKTWTLEDSISQYVLMKLKIIVTTKHTYMLLVALITSTIY